MALLEISLPLTAGLLIVAAKIFSNGNNRLNNLYVRTDLCDKTVSSIEKGQEEIKEQLDDLMKSSQDNKFSIQKLAGGQEVFSVKLSNIEGNISQLIDTIKETKPMTIRRK
jgi:hypothetical protein